jgi:hypothetical protein
MHILVNDPLAILVHDASLKHGGRTWPVKIDPGRYFGLGHSLAPADASSHLARDGLELDVMSQYIRTIPISSAIADISSLAGVLAKMPKSPRAALA